MTAPLEGGECSAARPRRTLPPGKTRYPLYRRMGGLQERSGRAENLVPTGILSWAVQPLVGRYTSWATRSTLTDKYDGYLYENVCIFMTVFLRNFYRMRHVADKRCKGNQNTYLYAISIFFFENRAVYEIMWKNVLQPDRPQVTLWCVSIGSWIPKATNTYSKFVILTVFLLQQRLD